ncbi:MAG: cobalamin-dependent protein [Gemmatimonadaceae bacterium]|nr:cobalamin-dependent protein [Gemmatimonadaceae bacterium]
MPNDLPDTHAIEAAEHPISVVASRTGLSRDVIRIWERRYGAVAPSRSAGRQRLYTDADIGRLRLLAAATRHGRNISLVAALSDDDLARLAVDDDTAHASVALGSAPSVERVVAAARVPVAALDAPTLDGQLRRVIAREGMSWFLDPFVPAFMRAIGDAWVAGELSIAEEHLASRVVKGLILETVRTAPMPAGAPRVLVATPSGDRHAVGAAMVAATATIEGWAVTYLGVDVPAADIVRAAASCGARVVALSAVYSGDSPRLMAELRAVRDQLPASVPLVLGGAAAAGAAADFDSHGTILCENLAALRATLSRAASAH